MVSEAIFDRVDFSLRKSVTSIEGEQKTLRLQEKTVESVLWVASDSLNTRKASFKLFPFLLN